MNGHGVIIGGGIGGLVAARALASRFERVTVLECYRYPADSRSLSPPARRGVPQSRCLHLLMAAGATAFDELVPGWRKELLALGAVAFDASADAAIQVPAGWLPRVRSGIVTYACSRALLENVLRRGFNGHPRVLVQEDQKVVGLLDAGRGRRVAGVRVAGTDGRGTAALAADLVVDASGRSSTLPEWIERLPEASGLRVQETVVESRAHYVSRWFHLEPAAAPDWHCLSIAPDAGTRFRAAMMLRAEHDCWGVVLLSPANEPLPGDDNSFLDFTNGLGDGFLRDALERARPLSPIQHYGVSPNRIRHYDRLTWWPAGLVALGDSVCALDPYFGLGMTMAARGAVLLGNYLQQESNCVVSGIRFQERLATLNAQPWQLATGCDVEGKPLARDAEYLERLYDSAPKSSEIAHALLAVQHLLQPIETLTDLCPR
jgi:2-polyprenyl-6-methoxyphenol hydroxylase-like FAD-dependent oxidoreductase